MATEYSISAKEKIVRGEESKLKVVVVGAGLGGLGAAISILLAGHDVLVLESASEIAEVGAGIQVLPNSSRVLQTWGMKPMLSRYATRPKQLNMLGWKGNLISSMDFHASAAQYPGTFYWDFHRANLHKCLYDRAVELGAEVRCNARVQDVRIEDDGLSASVTLYSGEVLQTDLLVGADGINSKLRELLLGYPDPPTPTGDLAYRLLLSTKDMMKDPELASFVTDPQVNYWMGPAAHAVNYVLRGGELFNMVLLVPDDMPADGASTLEGNVEEMRALYKDWDPRIPKLLSLCESVYKWRLCIRQGMDSWSHPSGAWTMLGDAVHATLPYLASGAGMALEDGAVLGECLSRIKDKSAAEKKLALRVYEQCRKGRTEMVVNRGNLQQYLYHLDDGPEQEERDRKMRVVPTPPGEALAWRDPELSPKLLGYDHVKDVRPPLPSEVWNRN
ncbi:probable 2-polyprenyl-6-methoxyphenol hydroxylase and related FAD-dependent oxidoreductases [Phialocephala subalpina]|uniref:Probable 2-polyprenyl-6-methoxyphenol hydroxylase and related FAD-dependent oxidoreductases n=1 Tax=Phialocephala subalpina TaxID=576137 RepID=A0A1L7WL31_9HELO|nr:probable 2-polyprenyl-6-methoxyphenol hydroxylase and related FAD-dependent oxidoreductases [Phialocephala subalpina]